MAETTGIAWTDATFNPWIGCTRVSPGCDHCYAAVSRPARAMNIEWGSGKVRHRTSASNWAKPLRWQRLAEKGLMPDGKTPTNGRRPRVFCASLADVFDNEVPSEWRSDLFRLIAKTPSLDWLILTKRIGNAAKMLHTMVVDAPPLPNVWLGASIVNQEEADRDIRKLFATPAAKWFVSYEPALGPVDWTLAFFGYCPEHDFHSGFCTERHHAGVRHLSLIIVGGESDQGAHKARPFDIEWARQTIAQCKAAGVPVFMKQCGSNPVSHSTSPHDQRLHQVVLRDRAGADPAEWPEDLRVQQWPA